MAGVVTLLALVLAVAASACGSVEIRATPVSGSERAACTRLVAALPDSVSDQRRRTSGGSSLGAAWGDPAIVLRCGVGKPADYDPLTGCQRVDGVDWYVPAEALHPGTDVVITTLGRTPAVEVTLPAAYRPPAAAMVDLGAAIRTHTRVVAPCS